MKLILNCKVNKYINQEKTIELIRYSLPKQAPVRTDAKKKKQINIYFKGCKRKLVNMLIEFKKDLIYKS